MELFENSAKEAHRLTLAVINKLVKSTNYSNRALEDGLHMRHGYIRRA